MKALLKLIANNVEYNIDAKQLVDFVIELEQEMKTMDFTEPLYQYFKRVMEREMPEGL